MKPRIVFFPAALDACALIRLFIPHLHTPNSIFMFNVVDLQPEKFAHCDVVMVQRLSTQENLAALGLFKRMGMKVVYDLDDDMWDVPIYNPAYKLMRQWLPGFNYCASQADLITVSTEHLKVMVRSNLGKNCPPVEVVENSMDFDWYQPVSDKYKKHRDGRVVIGWAGSNTHKEDVRLAFQAMLEVLKECPEVDFEVVGMPLGDEWKEFGDRARQKKFIPVAEFPVHWSSWQWDISLAPLEKNRFNFSKSALKAMEASSSKIPCVMSNMGEYKKFCSGSQLLKETVLAETKSSWKKKLLALVKSKDLRRQIGEEMYRVGRVGYDIQNRIAKWDAVFSGVTGE